LALSVAGWLVAHRPSVDVRAASGPPWWMWLLVGLAVLTGVVWAVYRWWNPAGARTGRKGAAFAAAVVLAVVALLLWGRG
jgi:hypothetical protein